MSMDYWAICGYGLNTEHIRFDLKKAQVELGIKDEDDLLETLANSCHFAWSYDARGATYFYLPSCLPWEANIECADWTEEIIAQEIINVLTLWLEADFNPEDLRGNIGYVSTYGCG